MKNPKDILYQSKQSINTNKYEHATATLATIFHKPMGEANTYVQFGYVPQKLL